MGVSPMSLVAFARMHGQDAHATNKSSEFQQRDLRLLLHLFHGALFRRLVRPPAKKFRSVSEAPAGEMVVADFDHQHRLERLPFRRALRAPAAGPAGLVAGETGRGDERLDFLEQLLPFGRFETRTESDV